MNYYRRYIGDYARDTAHLSLIEHGAYTLLLDTYYATETPLPASLESLYRICRAILPDEQMAVESVANQFFPNVGGRRRNTRAEKEISIGRDSIQKMSDAGKKGARSRWGPQPVDNSVENGNPNGLPYRVDDGHTNMGHPKHDPTKNDGVEIDPPTTNQETKDLGASKNAPTHKTSTNEYTDEFEDAWQRRPNRAGSDPKRRAYKAWTARLKSGTTCEEMLAGMVRYSAYCASTGKVGTEYAMQAATFFGPDEHYLEPWAQPPPEKQGNGAGPRTDDQWQKLGKAWSIPAKVGEPMDAYVVRLKGEYARRNGA